jgi:uncharacterized protein involved in exopolysaccharide biosynthesis
MNPRYAETFMRHPRAFLLPVLVSAVIAVWVVLGAGDTYRSTSNLWFDNSAPGQSSLAQPDGVVRPPAAQEQLLLNELLTTRRFRLDVGRRGPLGEYLRRHPANGWGPFTVVSQLRGVPALADRIVSALSTKHVIATISGPQVLAVSLDAPDPKVAAETLRALVQEFVRENTLLGVETGQRAVANYQRQVDLAAAAAAKARARVTDYLRLHPNARASSPRLVALRNAETAANAQLTNATTSLNQLAGDRPSAAAETTTFRVIDPPRIPRSPNGKHKKILFALIAGLFVGVGVSVMAVIASTRLDGLAKIMERAGVAAREPATANVVDEADPLAKAILPTGSARSSDRHEPQPTFAATPSPKSPLWDVPELWDDGPRSVRIDAEGDEPVKVEGATRRDDVAPVAGVVELTERAEQQRRDEHGVAGATLEAEEILAHEYSTDPANVDGTLITGRDGGGEEAAERDAAQGNGRSAAPEAELVGTIVEVRDEGEGRVTRPVWTIQKRSHDGTPVEQGLRVSLSGLRSREGVVRGRREGANGAILVDVEITNLKRAVKGEEGLLAVPPASEAWIGSEVVLVHQRSLRGKHDSNGAGPGETRLPFGSRPTSSVATPRA